MTAWDARSIFHSATVYAPPRRAAGGEGPSAWASAPRCSPPCPAGRPGTLLSPAPVFLSHFSILLLPLPLPGSVHCYPSLHVDHGVQVPHGEAAPYFALWGQSRLCLRYLGQGHWFSWAWQGPVRTVHSSQGAVAMVS